MAKLTEFKDIYDNSISRTFSAISHQNIMNREYKILSLKLFLLT